MRFSFVIPAFNEERYLPRLLDSIDVARDRWRDGRDDVEVIVGDNASTDRTAAIAQERGARVAHVEQRVIGAARNGGAAIARGNVLLFVDADMRVHPETLNVIDAAFTDRVVAGTTGITPERWSLGFALTYAVIVPMVWAMAMDTGVVFCRRADFETIGGYDSSRLFAEDVDFLFRLRRLGRKRGQKLTRARSAKAIASLRKFDEHGDWHYFTMMGRALSAAIFGGKQLRDFADWYWYKPRR